MGRTFWRSMAANISLTLGFYIGVKGADKILWNKQKYDQMTEEIEIDYWKKVGKPEYLEPELHRSSIKEGEFYQTYLKAKNRVEYLEEKVYKQN